MATDNRNCLPIDQTTADRKRSTNVWSGIIWRLLVLLREWRPDPRVSEVDPGPNWALFVVWHRVCSGITVTKELLDASLPYPSASGEGPKNRLSPVPGAWETVRSILPDQPFRSTNGES
jgi:hypothetical protein